jgi:ATP-binding cassette subfamily E protein 1
MVVDSETGETDRYVICVEHDLSVLDYLSDFICVLYGMPGAYGVVTMPFNVRDGINIFLAGYIGPENIRFRDVELNFKLSENAQEDMPGEKKTADYQYPDMKKTLVAVKKGSSFTLEVNAGNFSDSEIVVLLGENGTGKTTFIRMLAGLLKADPAQGELWEMPVMNISYKPQKISPKFPGTVRQLLHKRIRETYVHPQFVTDVTRPLTIEPLLDQEVRYLARCSLAALQCRAYRGWRRGSHARCAICPAVSCSGWRSHSRWACRPTSTSSMR